ncbi:hypothetical protein EI613_05600 [Azospirillum sp. 412522]|nr:hypothetical protein [Azospirillum sp. 412522]MBY6261405.1 hypothetical protein [Azospirillum sp. 412522]
MRISRAMLIPAVFSCAACSVTSGSIETQDLFTFPNSDVANYEDGTITLTDSKTVFAWDDAAIYDLRKSLIEKAKEAAKSRFSSEKSKKQSINTQIKDMDIPDVILINSKWKTTTNIIPFIPVVTYKLELTTTLAHADVYIKRID